MKVLVAAFAYNERPYIPYMVEYYRKQGCDLLILDNYSTDGTYEWLVKNKIMTSRVDTKDSFFLIKLQKALLIEFARIKPDWIIYTGVDMYYYFKEGIIKEIEKAMLSKCNTIKVNHIEVYNTGEVFKLPFQNNYFYISHFTRNLELIARYSPQLRFNGDALIISNRTVYSSDGFLINYGFCKSKEERMITLARRRKAWQLGNPKGQGSHYLPAEQRNWIWTKEELTDIRTTRFYTMMQ